MKCHNCSIEFDSLNDNDIFCTGTCIRLAKEKGWKPDDAKAPREHFEISPSRKKWDEVYKKYRNKECNVFEVLHAMNWCLKVDRDVEDRKMKEYMKRREEFFEE